MNDSHSKINEVGERDFLKTYQADQYKKPSVAVDMLVFTISSQKSDNIRKLDKKELKVLMVQRKEYPFKGYWGFPGGFVGVEESLEEAVYRKLKQKAHMENIYLEQLYTYGEVDRDPRMRVISTAYMALVSNENLKESKEKEDSIIQWFRIEKRRMEEKSNMWQVILIGEEDGTILKYQYEEIQVKMGVLKETKAKVQFSETKALAFDHCKILTDALIRMKNKALYLPIAFNLVGTLFTRAEIKSIYELLLDKELTRIELWRLIKDMVEETDLMKTEKGYRPSKYYKFKANHII